MDKVIIIPLQTANYIIFFASEKFQISKLIFIKVYVTTKMKTYSCLLGGNGIVGMKVSITKFLLLLLIEGDGCGC